MIADVHRSSIFVTLTNRQTTMKFKNIYHGVRFENYLIKSANTAYIECIFVNCSNEDTTDWKPGDTQSLIVHCWFYGTRDFVEAGKPSQMRPLTAAESNQMDSMKNYCVNTNAAKATVRECEIDQAQERLNALEKLIEENPQQCADPSVKESAMDLLNTVADILEQEVKKATADGRLTASQMTQVRDFIGKAVAMNQTYTFGGDET